VRLEVRPLHLAVEDVELVSEHHDLDLLCVLGAQGKDCELQKAAQDPIAQRQDDEVRFRLHGRGRLRHLPVRQPRPTLITKLTEFSAPTGSPESCSSPESLAQSGGFFLHLAVGQPGRPSVGTKLTRGGGLIIGAALITMAIGLIQTA
jgi:hypothetical protein